MCETDNIRKEIEKRPEAAKKVFRELTIPPDKVSDFVDETNSLLEQMLEYVGSNTPNRKLKLKMNGIGINRLDFSDRTCRLAEQNVSLAPAGFNVDDFKMMISRTEMLEKLSSQLKQALNIVNDELEIAGDESYSMALLYYYALRERTKVQTPGAEEAYNTLLPFFDMRRDVV